MSSTKGNRSLSRRKKLPVSAAPEQQAPGTQGGLGEHRRVEEALRRANESLRAQAEQLQALNDALQARQRELETANANLRRREQELQSQGEALLESEQRYRALFETAPDGIVVFQDGQLLAANAALLRLTGAGTAAELARHTVVDFFRPEDREQARERMRQAMAGRQLPTREATLRRLDGREIVVEFHTSPVDFQGTSAVQTLIRDITERKRAQDNQLLMNDVLRVLNGGGAGQALMAQVLQVICARTGFDAVGLRMREGADFPYYVQRGFSAQFVREENSVCARRADGSILRDADGQTVLECTCGLVLSGRTDPSMSCFTENGSFWTNKASDLLTLLPEADPRTHPRNGCIHSGYQSVALIPVRSDQGLLGLLQLNARREGQLSLELVHFLEALAGNIGLVLQHRRAEEALRQSEERYHRLFEDDLTADFLSTPEGRVLLCNPAFAAMFGFACAQDAVGTSVADLYLDPGEREPLWERLKRDGRIEGLQVWRRRRTGEPIHIIENLVGHFNERGELYEIKGYIFDDTQRQRAEDALRESRERLERAQEMAHLGSWELDLVRNRLTWSDEVYRIFGVPPGEFDATYKAFLDRVHPEDRAAVDAAYSRSLREGRDTYEIEHRIVTTSTAEIRIVHEKCEHIRDASGRIVRSIGMVHDVTESRRAEEALRRWNETLENRVAERTAELEHRTRQLQRLTLELTQAEERERRRIALLLHEDLQQQIAGAKFHLCLVRNRARNDRQRMDVDRIDEMLKEAIEKSRRLSYDLSPAVLHMNDLAELLQWLVKRVRAQHDLNVDADISGDLMLQSEALATFLFRAAQEMLFNAVQHAHVREATIRAGRIGRYVCISVADRGRGFDPQALRETSGIGLLSIRERVELLGGRMVIKSANAKGSRLRIVVPDALGGGNGEHTTEEVAGLPVPVSPPSAPGTLRVLLVDDHDLVRRGLAALLEEAPGIELVGQAGDGREAVNLAMDLHPDVVIMDASMPVMNGDQATRQIKALLPGTRVVALSMYDEADKREEMFRAGAEGYILKTVSADDLIAALRRRQAHS